MFSRGKTGGPRVTIVLGAFRTTQESSLTRIGDETLKTDNVAAMAAATNTSARNWHITQLSIEASRGNM
jgi:hypothetical protein